MKVGVKKLRVPWLPDSENHMILWLLVLTQSQHEMDRQTDRQTVYAYRCHTLTQLSVTKTIQRSKNKEVSSCRSVMQSFQVNLNNFRQITLNSYRFSSLETRCLPLFL